MYGPGHVVCQSGSPAAAYAGVSQHAAKENSSSGFRDWGIGFRFQVRNNHILTQNLYYNFYYPKPKYLIIGYLDP